MAKLSKKSEKTKARRGGSTFLGILIGLVLGLFIALGVAWYINKLPNPFKDKSQPSRTVPPAYPAKDAPTAPKASVPAVDDKAKPSAQEMQTKGEMAPAAAEKKSTAAVREAFFLQTGSFQSAPEADNLKARLALLGLEAAIQTRTLPDKGTWHRVRVGPYSDMDELNRVRSVLQQNNIEVALVKVREAEK
ncbi:MAG TPA: SPOR domain-containing protein [Burkholderiales bacterium]|nr:SPOR domain-containing protein [Burkholderiales bacterium]